MTKSLRRSALSCTFALGGALLLGVPVSSAVAADNRSSSVSMVAISAAEGELLAEWSWPVKPPYTLTRGFIAPETPYSAGHRGIDLELSPGQDIYAPADGVVHFSGRVASRAVLSLSHEGELLSSYEAVTSDLRKGDEVRAGDLIGVLADGGHCASRCVHFGVRLRGDYVSPLLLLGGVPRAILLPLG